MSLEKMPSLRDKLAEQADAEAKEVAEKLAPEVEKKLKGKKGKKNEK